jgi:hypothetical protein
MVEKWFGLIDSAQLVVMKELIEYETCHGIMWLGGEDQEIWLSYDRSGCKCEGQVWGFGAIDRLAMKLEQGLDAHGSRQ